MMRRKLSRRQFLKITAKSALASALAGLGGAGYIHEVEPRWVSVEHMHLMLPSLSSAFDGYRLVQISDIHIGDWMTGDRLTEIVQIANTLQPDLTVVTGDFVSVINNTLASDLSSALTELSTKDGVLGVLGNHDYWSNADMVREAIGVAHIINVSNNVHTLDRGGALLNIAGVDDVWERKNRLDDVLLQLPKEGAAILLAHEPDFADASAATGRFDLQLSGHSHGGQVRLPMLGPLRLPPFGVKYPMGLYQVGNMLQYTNRGVGMIRPYVRFNCRPEITLFTLEAAKSTESDSVMTAPE